MLQHGKQQTIQPGNKRETEISVSFSQQGDLSRLVASQEKMTQDAEEETEESLKSQEMPSPPPPPPHPERSGAGMSKNNLQELKIMRKQNENINSILNCSVVVQYMDWCTAT